MSIAKESAMGSAGDRIKRDDNEEIPMHLIRYFEEKLRAHSAEVHKFFDDHTSDEMMRYKQILKTIDNNRISTERMYGSLEAIISERHNALVQSIEHLLQKLEEFSIGIDSAFPKNNVGKADYAGHAYDHITRMKDAEEVRDFRRYIKRVVSAAAIIGVGTWLLYVIWPAILAGPPVK